MDQNEAVKKRPVSRSSMEKAIESTLRTLEATLHDWAVSRILSQWHFVVEDDDPGLDEDEHIEFVVHNLAGVLESPKQLEDWLVEHLLRELPGMYDEHNVYALLAQEWGIGTESSTGQNHNQTNSYAFKDQQEFIDFVDIDAAWDLLIRSWELACDWDRFGQYSRSEEFELPYQLIAFVDGKVTKLT